MSASIQRQAPKDGYEFASKARFRRWAWNFIGGMKSDGSIRTGDVLLMPSVEGLEISDEALPRGFTTSQLHVVDKNPAIVATIQRKFPGVNTYGCAVERAVERMDQKGVRLIAASVDYCSQLSPTLLRGIKQISEAACCKDAVLIVNFLRGREEKYLTSLFAGSDLTTQRLVKTVVSNDSNRFFENDDDIEPTEMDALRAMALYRVTGRTWYIGRAYKSTNGQSFLTIVFNSLTPQAQTTGPEEWGDPIDGWYEDESWEAFYGRLTSRQAMRLSYMLYVLGLSRLKQLSRYIKRIKRPHQAGNSGRRKVKL